LQQAADRGARILALMPQPVAEAEQYLNSEGVHVDQIKQLPLRTIGVEGTPSLLLVDGAGIVTKVWTARFADPEQEQMLTILKEG
jgi:hypothetical protein